MNHPLPHHAGRIGDCVRFHAAIDPEHPACVEGGAATSYGGLVEDVARWSKALLAAGVKRGDRVAMLAVPSARWLTIMLATTDIGAIWTGYHPRYRLGEFRHVTGLAEPKVLIAPRHLHGRDYTEELTTLQAEFPVIEHLVMDDDPIAGAVEEASFLAAGDRIEDATLEDARAAVVPQDTAVLIFTSGTTGRPKAAMVRHLGLLTGAAVEIAHWPMERPRILHMMPVNHIAGVGMTGVFGVFVGGTLIFQDRFDPGGMLDLIEGQKIDHVLGSPIQFHMMVHDPGFEGRDFSHVHYWTWGGAPMAVDLVKRMNALPGKLRTSYGMTELGLYVTFTDSDASFEALSKSIGRPHEGFEIRVADAEGNIAHPGGTGEIQVRGDWLFAGYFRDPEGTVQAHTTDGWFRTGDVVKVWQDGNLEIVGRTREMFISGGFNIYPREIELVIEEHPATGLVAVLGVADEVFGEIGHAFVEARPGAELTVEELKAWCRERLANYKVPKVFEITAQMPRLPIGKIDKQALRRELAQGCDKSQGVMP